MERVEEKINTIQVKKDLDDQDSPKTEVVGHSRHNSQSLLIDNPNKIKEQISKGKKAIRVIKNIVWSSKEAKNNQHRD